MRKTSVTMLAALALLTSSCGADSASTPTVIDPTKLEVGNYPTTPIDIEALRTPDSGYTREAIRIGTHTPLPHEYDSRFIYGPEYAKNQAVTPQEPPYVDTETGIARKDFNQEFPGLVAGWRTFGARRFSINMGRGLETHTLRFESPDKARAAANKWAAPAPGTPFRIDGYPDAQTKNELDETSGIVRMRTWLVREDILIFIRVQDPVSRPAEDIANAEITKRFLDSQIDRLQSYSRTPLKEISKLALDDDGLFSRTIPADNKNIRYNVYPAHVALSFSQTPVQAGAAFGDAGVDYVVMSGAFVYRTRDAAAAERLSAAFGSGAMTLDDLTEQAASPPNFPTATCYEGDKNKSVPPSCRFVVGRYVVRVGGSNLQDAHQRAGAQYRLLVDAG